MPGPVFLHGERVTLRPVEHDDAALLQRGHNDPAVRVPLGMRSPTNEAQIEERIEDWVEGNDGVNLLVCLDEEPIGQVDVMHHDWTRPELAYWLLPEHHGEGYMTEAVSLVIDYFFETFEKRGLAARAFSSNDASRGLLERLGFTEEGRLREHRFVGGEYVDTIFYGLLREEWVEED